MSIELLINSLHEKIILEKLDINNINSNMSNASYGSENDIGNKNGSDFNYRYSIYNNIYNGYGYKYGKGFGFGYSYNCGNGYDCVYGYHNIASEDSYCNRDTSVFTLKRI